MSTHPLLFAFLLQTPYFTLAPVSFVIFCLFSFNSSDKMHVLLLKEPRDGESGIDPYIKVDAFTQVHYTSAHFILLCVFEIGAYYCENTGAGITWTHSNPHSCAIFYICLIKYLVRKGKVYFTVFEYLNICFIAFVWFYMFSLCSHVSCSNQENTLALYLPVREPWRL